MGLKMCLLITLVIVTVLTHESTAKQSHCNQPLETGPCKASILRYGYDPKLGQCKAFIYGGCDGNENNFRNFEDCKTACENHL